MIIDYGSVTSENKPAVKLLSEKSHYEETLTDQDIIFDDNSVTSNEKPCVKVLSEKSHSEVLKIIDDFRKSEQARGSIDAANINLSSEFSEILSPGGYEMVN